MRRMLVFMLCFLLGFHAAVADTTWMADDGLIERGAARYAEGLDSIKDDPIRARSLFAEAAAAFEQAADGSGVPNAELYRAIGNAQILAGNTGRAVLAFRRSLVADPSNDRAADGLKLARASLSVEASASNARRVLDVVNMWPQYVAPWIMKVVFAMSWGCFWLALLIARVHRQSAPPGTLAAVATLAIAAGVALAANAWDDAHERDVVVVAQTSGYNGPSSEVYEPTFEQPVPAGMEAALVETRDNWSQIELRNGSRTWVRRDAIELVSPGPR